MNRAHLRAGDPTGAARPGPRHDGGPFRVLTITADELGWRTYAESLSSTTARRDDVEAVHVGVRPTRWTRLAGAKVGGWRPPGRFDPHYRRTLVEAHQTRRWLQRELDLREFDVVHATPQLAALPVLGLQGCPPIVVGLDATILQGKMQRRSLDDAAATTRFGPLRDLERRVLGSAAMVVCMSDWAREAVTSEAMGEDVPTTVIPPSLPGATLAAGTSGAGPVRIVFVGNDWERKGGPRLLAWHQEHLRDEAELHVCSAGAPAGLDLAGVVWHGATPRDRLLGEVLPSMDLFALPTRSDMSPWAVVEAVGAGLPVLSSAIGGISELVVDGVTGRLVDPDDDVAGLTALRELVLDGELRRRMAAATAQRASTVLDHGALGDRLVQVWNTAAPR